MKVWWQGFHFLIGLLLQAAGYVSSGNLPTFDVIGSKVHQTIGNNIVTIGNKETKLPVATPCRRILKVILIGKGVV